MVGSGFVIYIHPTGWAGSKDNALKNTEKEGPDVRLVSAEVTTPDVSIGITLGEKFDVPMKLFPGITKENDSISENEIDPVVSA